MGMAAGRAAQAAGYQIRTRPPCVSEGARRARSLHIVRLVCDQAARIDLWSRLPSPGGRRHRDLRHAQHGMPASLMMRARMAQRLAERFIALLVEPIIMNLQHLS